MPTRQSTTERQARLSAQQTYAILQDIDKAAVGSANSVDRDLWSVAEHGSAPNRWLAVAIWRSATGIGRVNEPLLRHRRMRIDLPASLRDREAANWNRALTAPMLTPADCRLADAMSKGARLGWYGYVLMARVYRAGGDRAAADAARAMAVAPGRRAYIPIVAMVALFVAGCALLAHDAWRMLQGNPRPAAPPAEADPLVTNPSAPKFLYGVFVAYLAGYVLLHGVVPTVLSPVLRLAAAPTREVVQTIAQFLNAAALVAAPLLALRWGFTRGVISWADINIRTNRLKQDALHGLAAYLKVIPALGVVLIVSAIAFRGVDSPTNPAITALAEGGSLFSKIGIVLLASLVAPLCEELMFRGVLLRSLSANMSPRKAIVLSALVFAALHPQLPLGFPGLFALGALFGTLAIRTRSLIPGLVAHSLNNTVIVLAVLLSAGQ